MTAKRLLLVEDDAALAELVRFHFERDGWAVRQTGTSAKTAVTNLNIEDFRERYARWFGALNHRERDELTVLRVNGKEREVDAEEHEPEP